MKGAGGVAISEHGLACRIAFGAQAQFTAHGAGADERCAHAGTRSVKKTA